jgi:hypothetical protein
MIVLCVAMVCVCSAYVLRESRRAEHRAAVVQQVSNWRPARQAVTLPLRGGLSASCAALNRRIVAQMNELHVAGLAPAFSTTPLMEILRTGSCEDDAPAVRVLQGWLEEARAQMPQQRTESASPSE